MLLPATTGSGLSMLLTTCKSADVVTVVVVDAESLPGVASLLALATVAVLVIIVPLAVPALTVTLTWKDAVSPTATDAFVIVTLLIVLLLASQVAGVVTEAMTVLAGAGLVITTLVATFGP